jgi:hypothetical protein
MIWLASTAEAAVVSEVAAIMGRQNWCANLTKVEDLCLILKGQNRYLEE